VGAEGGPQRPASSLQCLRVVPHLLSTARIDHRARVRLVPPTLLSLHVVTPRFVAIAAGVSSPVQGQQVVPNGSCPNFEDSTSGGYNLLFVLR
jgi:hypothetical protein